MKKSDEVEIETHVLYPIINIFYKYNYYFEHIGFLKNPDKLLNMTINPIFQNESIIRENIKVYGFNDELKIIDNLIKGNYNEIIMNLWFQKLNNDLNFIIKHDINYYVDC